MLELDSRSKEPKPQALKLPAKSRAKARSLSFSVVLFPRKKMFRISLRISFACAVTPAGFFAR